MKKLEAARNLGKLENTVQYCIQCTWGNYRVHQTGGQNNPRIYRKLFDLQKTVGKIYRKEKAWKKQ